MHENFLDIKAMIKSQEAKQNQEKVGIRLSIKKSHKLKELSDRDQELKQRAKYCLRKLDDGKIDPSDKTLLFESKFESGNLYLAQKVSENEYNCLMQNDINTSGHT